MDIPPGIKNLNTVKSIFQTSFQAFVMTDIVQVVNFLYYFHLTTARNMPVLEDTTWWHANPSIAENWQCKELSQEGCQDYPIDCKVVFRSSWIKKLCNWFLFQHFFPCPSLSAMNWQWIGYVRGKNQASYNIQCVEPSLWCLDICHITVDHFIVYLRQKEPCIAIILL